LGVEMRPVAWERLSRAAGRTPRQRTTLYGTPPTDQVARSFGAAPLRPPHNPPAREAGLRRPEVLLRPRV
jgi:FO synthase